MQNNARKRMHITCTNMHDLAVVFFEHAENDGFIMLAQKLQININEKH